MYRIYAWVVRLDKNPNPFITIILSHFLVNICSKHQKYIILIPIVIKLSYTKEMPT